MTEPVKRWTDHASMAIAGACLWVMFLILVGLVVRISFFFLRLGWRLVP